MTTPNLAKQDYLRDIAAKLTAAKFGGKADIIKTACGTLNISRPQL